ncbi:MAG: hypothetical protein K5657_00070 [Desulfovibrio sp.]|nr:hypothetical protein [Desulfovibrio sp.]
MLEVAASPAYKDLLDALGKLTDWLEQAGQGSLPSGPPPSELVQQFNDALNASPIEAVQGTQAAGVTDASATEHDSVSQLDGTSRSQEVTNVQENSPPDILGKSDFFHPESEPVRSTETDMTTGGRRFTDQQGEPEMTKAQEINLDRGLETLDNASGSYKKNFLETAQELSELLSKPSAEISPIDLLQAQRLMGVMKVHGESGKKVSEGVSDTLEQLLEQQG